MQKTFFTVALFTIFLVSVANAQQNGWMSRYWDGCKPSCSWSGKNYANNVGRCKECNKQNQLMSTSDANRSSCEGGNSYTCWDMVPWKIDDNLAYAFAATPSDQCGQCFELTFDGGFKHGGAQATHAAIKGKKLIVMGSNMGGDVGAGQFDLLVPGGGVGLFDSFSGQIGVSNSALGAQYGGLLAACNNPGDVAQAQSCLKGKCAEVFGKSGQEWLKAGCDFYADWLKGANNPTMTYKTVTCPQALVDRYQKAATGTPGGGGGTTPTNYTLPINKSPNVGTVTGAGSVEAGKSHTISATVPSGYTFVNWTVTTGSATITNANNASTTVTLTGNATITANFQATYTLTINRNPTNIGTVTGAGSGKAAGIQHDISASAPSGYTFSGWTTGTGATIANVNSATTKVTLTGNATITANFTQIPTTPTEYTLTINRNPTNIGTVTGAGSVTAGTPKAITATANSDYDFDGWTAGSGATIANVNNASTTVTLTANATITANFKQKVKVQCPDNSLTLTKTIVPSQGGKIEVEPAKDCYSNNESITVKAVPNTGWEFEGWEGDGTWPGAPADLGSTSMWWHRTLIAYFKEIGGGGGGEDGPPQARTEETIIEAEDFDSKIGNFQIGEPNSAGVIAIGYIENGHTATYEINALKAGTVSLRFNVATGLTNSAFTVWVNGTKIDRVSLSNTGGWSNYELVTLHTDPNLVAGKNTIELRFESAINVDFISILAEPGTLREAPPPPEPPENDISSIKIAQINAGVISMRAGVKGFNAILPVNHSYNSYKLIDLQGREIRSGQIKAGVTDLSFDNIKSGVIFLKLEGIGTSKVVRAFAY